MASEHLMKASPPSLMVAAHTPFLVVELHIVHNSFQPFAATDLLPSAAGHLSPDHLKSATCLLNPFSSDHLLPNLPEETDQKIAAWIQSDQVGSKHLISDQEQKFYLMTDQNEH